MEAQDDAKVTDAKATVDRSESCRIPDQCFGALQAGGTRAAPAAGAGPARRAGLSFGTRAFPRVSADAPPGVAKQRRDARASRRVRETAPRQSLQQKRRKPRPVGKARNASLFRLTIEGATCTPIPYCEGEGDGTEAQGDAVGTGSLS